MTTVVGGDRRRRTTGCRQGRPREIVADLQPHLEDRTGRADRHQVFAHENGRVCICRRQELARCLTAAFAQSLACDDRFFAYLTAAFRRAHGIPRPGLPWGESGTRPDDGRLTMSQVEQMLRGAPPPPSLSTRTSSANNALGASLLVTTVGLPRSGNAPTSSVSTPKTQRAGYWPASQRGKLPHDFSLRIAVEAAENDTEPLFAADGLCTSGHLSEEKAWRRQGISSRCCGSVRGDGSMPGGWAGNPTPPQHLGMLS